MERFSATEFTLNPKGLDEVWRTFEVGGSEASLMQGIAELTAAEGEDREAAVSGVVADLAEFRAGLKRPETPDAPMT